MKSLDRFKVAQASRDAGFEAAARELKGGRKLGHWIWYIFPQMEGLGYSEMSRSYALFDTREAQAFLSDPVLGARLMLLTNLVAAQLAKGIRLANLMGGRIDALKLVSSLTLFELALRELGPAGIPPHCAELPARCSEVLASAEREGFPRCSSTLEHVRRGAGR